MRCRLAPLIALVIVGCSRSPSPEQLAEQQSRCESKDGFVWVEGGDYLAGSDTAERDYGYRVSAEAVADEPEAIARAEAQLRQRGWFDREPERQTASLPGFCLSQFLTTNQDYQEFVVATGHRAPGISAADYQAQGFLVHPYEDVVPFLWQGHQFPAGKADHPVVLVSYEDAIAYANWRSEQDGLQYRLPTPAEWEKAARGTDGRYFPWGNTWSDDATNWGERLGGTSAVGEYGPSPYGLFDMAGNLFEYTATRRSGQQTVMKGCSWDDLPGFCRAAYRHTRPADSRHILFGFRLLQE